MSEIFTTEVCIPTPGQGALGLEVLAERNLGFTPASYGEVVPKGADFSSVPIAAAAASGRNSQGMRPITGSSRAAASSSALVSSGLSQAATTIVASAVITATNRPSASTSDRRGPVAVAT